MRRSRQSKPHLYRVTGRDGSITTISGYSLQDARRAVRGGVKVEQVTDPEVLKAWGPVGGQELS